MSKPVAYAVRTLNVEGEELWEDVTFLPTPDHIPLYEHQAVLSDSNFDVLNQLMQEYWNEASELGKS